MTLGKRVLGAEFVVEFESGDGFWATLLLFEHRYHMQSFTESFAGIRRLERNKPTCHECSSEFFVLSAVWKKHPPPPPPPHALPLPLRNMNASGARRLQAHGAELGA